MSSGSKYDVSADVGVHEIQQILLPRENLPGGLYFGTMETGEHGLAAAGPEQTPLRIAPEEQISTDSYFNSFYLSYWRAHTNVRRIGLRVRYRGQIQVSAVINDGNGEPISTPQTQVELHSPDGAADSTEVFWVLEDTAHSPTYQDAHRISLTIHAHTASELHELSYVTDAPPERDVSLSLGLCTFNREANLVDTLGELLQFAEETNFISRIILVNHGPEFADPVLQRRAANPLVNLIQQRNLGGCGGFNRTMYEAAFESEAPSHHLLMDDDIILDARVIKRAVAFLKHANRECVLGGHMIDSSAPTTLFEAGARLDPFWRVVTFGRHLNILDPAELGYFKTDHSVDYNGWWFCILPTKAIRELGLSPPIFIHGDDIEYGCRLRRSGYPVIPLPGVAVWHEPFFLKNSDWQNFYDLRNRLIYSLLYNEQTAQSDAVFILGFCMEFVLTHRYRAAEMSIAAVLDYLKGPDAVLGTDAEEKHAEVMTLARSLPQPDPIEQIEPSMFAEAQPVPRDPSPVKLAGMFVRRFFALSVLPFSSKATHIFRFEDLHPGVLANSAYLLSDDIEGKRYLRFSLKRWRLWKSTARTLAVTVYYLMRRKSVNQAWRTKIGHYQTRQAWEQIFARADPDDTKSA